MSRRAAGLVALGLLAGACGGGPEEQDAIAPSSQPQDQPTSTASRAIVVGATDDDLVMLRAVITAELVEVIELHELIIVASPGCDASVDDRVSCVASAADLGSDEGSDLVVVLDDDHDGALQVAQALESRARFVIAGEARPESHGLYNSGHDFVFVPAGLSTVLGDVATAFLIAARDELAAYEPIQLPGGEPAVRAHTFLDDRYEQLTGIASPTPAEPDVTAIPEPEIRWTFDTGDDAASPGLHERAVVVGDVVAFLGNDGLARGLDTADGSLLWSHDIGAGSTVPQRGSVAAAAGGVVLMGIGTQAPAPDGSPRSLWAFDADTGSVIWELPISPDGAVGHPVTDGDRVYVWIADSDSEASLRALEVDDGSEIWRFEAAMSFGPPAVVDGEIWTGDVDGVLHGLDAGTGEEVVRFERIGLGLAGLASRPAVVEDLVLFGNDNGTFYAVDRATGDLAWSFPTGSADLPSSPAVLDDLVVFGSFDGGVYALEIGTGEVSWRYDGGQSAFLSSPAVADGVVYIGDFVPPASIVALDGRTGAPIWELPVDDVVGASPVVSGKTVYIQVPGTFYALAR